MFSLDFDYNWKEPFCSNPKATFAVRITRLKKDGEPDARTSRMVVQIHTGYARILAGLQADISHGRINTSGMTLFRQTYAEKIFDEVATELKTAYGDGTAELGYRWRSEVLNPLLQRQLQGYPDHEAPMLAKHFEGFTGSALSTAIDNFYFAKDPLAPENQRALRRGVLYVTEYRVFLFVGKHQEAERDLDHYSTARKVTTELYKELANNPEGAEGDKLSKFEVRVIVAELLEDYYLEDVEASVSVMIDPG